MKCCKCGKELPDHARFCKYCGAEQAVVTESAEPAKKKKRWPMIAALILVLIAGGIGGYVYFSGKAVPELIHDISKKISGNTPPSMAKVADLQYSSEGNLQSTSIYKYSDGGLKAECVRWSRDPENAKEQHRRFTYYELSEPYDLSSVKYIKNCNESGKITGETVYEKNGKKVTYKSYESNTLTETIQTYNNSKRLLKIQTFQDGVLSDEVIQKWDRNGKLLSRERNGEPEATTEQQIYRKYDDHGNIAATCNIMTFPANEETGTESFKMIATTYSNYDADGNEIKKVMYYDGRLSAVVINEYRKIDDLDKEVDTPEKRVAEENKTDDFSLFTEEVKQANSE